MSSRNQNSTQERLMSSTNQTNKAAVWDYWQKLNHVPNDQIADVVRAACHRDVDWNGSAPIDRLVGVDALISGFWEPLLRSFPDLERTPDIFMGGIDDGQSRFAGDEGTQWVSGCGHLTGTFEQDWLGIPASHKKTHMYFGQFYVMRDAKIAESYVMFDILSVMRQAGYEVLPPSPGADGGKMPAPAAGDGILLTEQDPIEGRRTSQLVAAMASGLERYVRDRDGADMSRMEQWNYWTRDMKWYGYSGIGRCHTLEEFEDFHQRPWLHGFGDRGLTANPDHGRVMGFVGEGSYACGGVWDVEFSHHHGTYAGIEATGKVMTMRDFDWWKRGPNGLLIENWVPIDLIDLTRQMGVDLMERLAVMVEDRKARQWW